MKEIKTFEKYTSEKDYIISYIKKYITRPIALQETFRDDKKNKFITLNSWEESNHDYKEYITMLDVNDVLVETYCDNRHFGSEIESYETKYEDLDIEILQKISNMVFSGDIIDII